MTDHNPFLAPGALSWWQQFALGLGAIISTQGLRNATWWQGAIAATTSFGTGLFIIPAPAEYFGWSASGTAAASMIWGLVGAHVVAAFLKQAHVLANAESPFDVALGWWNKFRGRG